MVNSKSLPRITFEDCQEWWRGLSAVFGHASDVVHVSDVFAFAPNAMLSDDQALDAIDWAKIQGMLEPFPGGSYVRLTTKGLRFSGLAPRLTLIVNEDEAFLAP